MEYKISKESQMYIPPKRVANAAAHGLKLCKKFGVTGIEVELKRAKQLVKRQPLTWDIIVRINKYFLNLNDFRFHQLSNTEQPSTDYIIWLLLGGQAGKAWIEGIKLQLSFNE